MAYYDIWQISKKQRHDGYQKIRPEKQKGLKQCSRKVWQSLFTENYVSQKTPKPRKKPLDFLFPLQENHNFFLEEIKMQTILENRYGIYKLKSSRKKKNV